MILFRAREQLKKYIIGNEKNLAYPLREQAGDYLGFFWVTDTLIQCIVQKRFFCTSAYSGD